MSNHIPDSLKTGIAGEGELNAVEQAELNVNVTSTVMSFVMYAMKTASLHVEHTGRTEVTPRDIKRAMMIEVFVYFQRADLAETVAECREMLLDEGDEIEGDEDDEIEGDEGAEIEGAEGAEIEGDEGAEIEDAEIEDAEMEGAEMEDATPCACPICAHMEIIEEQWKSYVPEDELGCILKKHIDAM